MSYCSSRTKECKCIERSLIPSEVLERKLIHLALVIEEMKTTDPSTKLYENLLQTVKTIRGSWFVDSIEHDFCFWTYINSNPRKHTLQECAELMGISISAVGNIEKRALDNMRNKYKNL